MTDIPVLTAAVAGSARSSAAWVSPPVTRVILLGVIALAAVAGFVAVPHDPAAIAADPDLTRLLRAMTGLKLLMAAGASAAVMWRLRSPASPSWLAAYALSCGAMFAGPGLIWNMAHLGLGALLLHAGLLATIALVWRDPVVAHRLQVLIAARRAVLRRR